MLHRSLSPLRRGSKFNVIKKIPVTFKTTQGKCSANNMPALLFFHVSSPCIHTQCVGGSPLFGSQASFQNSSPSSPLCWIEAQLCATVLLPMVLIHTLPQHPLALLESRIESLPKIAGCLTENPRVFLIISSVWIKYAKCKGEQHSIITCKVVFMEIFRNPFSLFNVAVTFRWLMPCCCEWW